MSEMPLARFTVLDLTRVRSGPTAVRQLADWGANVIKIERPGGLDGFSHNRLGFDFQNLHRNKRSMTLDLKAPAGRDLFLRLVKQADVVVENYRPDVKERLGIAYDDLRAVNPGIVLASISGFGQTGPYRDLPGFDQVAQGLGGLMSITGLPGQGPVRAGIPVADLSAGLYCAIGILVALLGREATGQGQWVQTSLLQAQVAMLDFQAVRWLMDGVVPPQAGNYHPTTVPMGVFPTQDGQINLAVTGQAIYERFCRLVGREEWIADPKFATNLARYENREAMNAAVAEILSGRPSREWIQQFNQAGI
ncbi:MAG: CoA transferase, partial [Anaerolineales bacterium]|nr:CoA transferase [Anaerolineales bacterium]